MTECLVYRNSPAMRAYQWDCIIDDLPDWVYRCCYVIGDVLVHERPSGRQQVYVGEWLVQDIDGKVLSYTPEEFDASFIVMRFQDTRKNT